MRTSRRSGAGRPWAIGAWALAAAAATAWLAAGDRAPDAPPPTGSALDDVVAKRLLRGAAAALPLSFEVNRGQTDEAVRYVARGQGSTLFLTDTEAVFAFSADGRAATDVLRMQFVGAGAPEVVGLAPSAETSNYLRPGEASIRGVPHFGEVSYADLYPGIDLRWHGDRSKLEYDLTVRPGADASSVRIAMKGAHAVRVTGTGDLAIGVGGAEIVQSAPVAWQTKDGLREPVAAAFAVAGDVVGLRLGAYDRSRPVVIDPSLFWSTFLGGAGGETGRHVAVDFVAGVANAFVVCGATTSIDFPSGFGHLPTTFRGDTDAYVAKLNLPATAVFVSTYVGGTGYDEAWDVAVDPTTHDIWVTGQTFSVDFPTYRAQQTAKAGLVPATWDAFVFGLDGNGDTLRYASYLGGQGDDFARGIAVDAFGDVYVTGFTSSSAGFPTAAALQPTYGGGAYDAFVTVLAPTLAVAPAPSYAYDSSTYWGGFGDDRAYDVRLRPSGGFPEVFIAGYTTSSNFPHFNNVSAPIGSTVQDAFGGFSDAFMARFDPLMAGVEYSTWIGGSGFEAGNAIDVDTAGNAVVTGRTDSRDLPRVLALQNNRRGRDDAFVVKLMQNARLQDPSQPGDPGGFVTYLGGSNHESGNDVAFDRSGATPWDIYVLGDTDSANFPTTPDAFQSALNGGVSATDAFLVRLAIGFHPVLGAPTVAPVTLKLGTYVGGADYDYGNGLAWIAHADFALCGTTRSGSFPHLGGLPGSLSGDTDAFVLRLATAGIFPAGELTVEGRTPDSVALTWQVHDEAQIGFQVDRTSPDGTTTSLPPLPPDATGTIDSGLAPDTAYTYSVIALNGDGTRTLSTIAAGATLPYPPSAPVGLVATADGSLVVLDWTDTSANEKGFDVERSVDAGAFETVARVGADVTHYEGLQVVAGPQVSSWRVVATNRGGASSPTQAAEVTTAATLPIDVRSGAITDSALPGGDRVTVKGRFVGASTFDPARDAVQIAVGDASNPLVLKIGAGERGWKRVRRGVYAFASGPSFPDGVRVKLTLDARRGVFVLSVARFDFPAAAANPVSLGLALGHQAGAMQADWISRGEGKLATK